MILSPQIIRDNPRNLYLVEIAYFARPQHCHKEEYWLPNTVTLSTKWWCCGSDKAWIRDWEGELIKPIWAKELEEIKVNLEGEFDRLVICDKFGMDWAQLHVNAPELFKLINVSLSQIL